MGHLQILQPPPSYLPPHLQARLTGFLQAAYAQSTNDKTMRMLRRLVAIAPPVLPMFTHEQLLRAIDEVLCQGGKNGGSRSENAVYDFKRAVQLWHNTALAPAVEENLETALARDILKGVRNMAPAPVPKNERYYLDAEHGHLRLPANYFLRCLVWADAKIARSTAPLIGFQRDVLIMVLLFALTRRFDECSQATYTSFVDCGVGKGINWVIYKMKNAQRERTVIPIPEEAASGVRVCDRIRAFLAIAPRDGRLFRGTMNAVGNGGHVWEPASRPKPIFDASLIPTWVWVDASYTSGEWNEAFKRLLAEAVPEADARVYSAHSLRVGGITAGAEAGLTLEQLSRCAAHKSLDSTKGYIRDDLDVRRSHFARIGAINVP
jgi:hypothetical protein